MAEDDDVTAHIGRRIIGALLALPGFEPGVGPYEAVQRASGDRVTPGDDGNGNDQGGIVVTGPDGAAQQMPGHHYLEHQVRQASESDSVAARLYDQLRARYDL